MAKEFLESKNIKVYPSAYRGNKTDDNKLYDPEARIPSEKNITQQINGLLSSSTKGFVVEPVYSTEYTPVFSSDAPVVVKFCLYGYYFEVTIDKTLCESFTDNIYAYLKVANKNTSYSSESNTEYAATSLIDVDTDGTTSVALDSSNLFKGLGLTDDASILENSNYKALHLFTKHSNEWCVPSSAYFKFKSTDIVNTDYRGNPVSIATKFYTGYIKATGEIYAQGQLSTSGNIYVSNDIDAAELIYSRGGLTAIAESQDEDVCTTKEYTEATYVRIDNLQQKLLDMVYPVGSIYISVNETSPAVFLGGTWELLSKTTPMYLCTSTARDDLNRTVGSNAGYILNHNHPVNDTKLEYDLYTMDAYSNNSNMSILEVPAGSTAKLTLTKYLYASGGYPFNSYLSSPQYATTGVNFSKLTTNLTHTHTTNNALVQIEGTRHIANSAENSTANMPYSMYVNMWKRIA